MNYLHSILIARPEWHFALLIALIINLIYCRAVINQLKSCLKNDQKSFSSSIEVCVDYIVGKRMIAAEDKLRKHVEGCMMPISNSIADKIYLINKRLNVLEDEENKQVYNIGDVAKVGDVAKDGVNTKTYQGNNVWTTTLVHEGQENTALGSEEEGEIARWRSIGACVDKPEAANSGE